MIRQIQELCTLRPAHALPEAIHRIGNKLEERILMKEDTMLKLNAGFSRKVGESNFGSRGASVNVEFELESHLINDPDGLRSRISGLFDLARRSVDDELKSQAPSPSNTNNNGHRSVRYATQSQIRAINAICQRIRRDPAQEANLYEAGVAGNRDGKCQVLNCSTIVLNVIMALVW